MVKLIAWNIAQRAAAWRELANSDIDIALLQEATPPPADIAAKVKVDDTEWETGAGRNWRTAIVQLSDQVQLQPISAMPLAQASAGELGVSRPGTLAAAHVTPQSDEPFIAVSVYGAWERPHSLIKGSFIYADASVHRLISDLSVFTTKQQRQNILVAGDLNVLYGHGEYGNPYWAGRYETVFARMAALGLEFVGPQAPHGRQAVPWPDELPSNSKNVPTYYARGQTPATCTRQLDFVFASERLARRMCVRALNDLQPDRWGPSDHCRIEIEIR
jgi:endonuclease/exonuclease/phosphatase family metal-dependent hydrolase